MRGRAFRCGAKRSRMTGCPRHRAMTPDPAPSVQQLLAFYLEAGVDCALTDEPVNRLSDPDAAPAPPKTEPRDAAAPRTFTQTRAPVPATRSEATLVPEAAISSAREAARTAPSL